MNTAKYYFTKVNLIVLFSATCLSIFAQGNGRSCDFNWDESRIFLDATFSKDFNEFTCDNQGNIYITGAMKADNPSGDLVWANSTLSSDVTWTDTDDQLFLAKLDSNGNQGWIVSTTPVRANGNNETNIYDDPWVRVDAQGNVYLLAMFNGSLELEGQVIDAGDDFTRGFFIAKFDDSGNLLWVKNTITTRNYAPNVVGDTIEEIIFLRDFEVSQNGDLLIVADLYNGGFDYNGSSYNIGSATNDQHIFMVLNSADGSVKFFDNTGVLNIGPTSGGLQVTEIENGNIVVVTEIQVLGINNNTIGLGNFDFSSNGNYLNYHYYRVEYEPNGSIVSANYLLNRSTGDNYFDFAMEPAGADKLYIYTEDPFNDKMHLYKLNSTGSVWHNEIDGDFATSNANHTKVAVDNSNNVYLGAVPPSSNSITVNGVTVEENELFVVKIDSNGNYSWVSTLSGMTRDVEGPFQVNFDYNQSVFFNAMHEFRRFYLGNNDTVNGSGFGIFKLNESNGEYKQFGYSCEGDSTSTDSTNTDTTSTAININFDQNSIDVKIFPNPSNGIFTFEILDETEEYTFSIIDIMGSTIFQSKETGTQFNIDLSNKANGIYYVQLQAKSGMHIKRIIKY